ncbi:hypothetical protein CR513_09505, partial [Mucuna pruriens]
NTLSGSKPTSSFLLLPVFTPLPGSSLLLYPYCSVVAIVIPVDIVIDLSWINSRCTSDEYESRVKSFLDFAKTYAFDIT